MSRRGRDIADAIDSGELLTLAERGEMGSGVRLGGILDDQIRGLTKCIWKGRPPVLEDGRPLQTLAVAGVHDKTGLPGDTVTVEVQAGNYWGGVETRSFAIGGGLSALLRLGNYEHILVRVMTKIPPGMKVRFAWSLDLSLQPNPLYTFLNYPVPGALTPLPEGTEGITPQNAGTLTFLLDQFGTTFLQPAAAGVEIPAIWSAFSYNLATKFILRLRGI